MSTAAQILVPRIEAVQAGSAAERAGFQPGDLVLSINGRPISSFADMQRIVSASAGRDAERRRSNVDGRRGDR